MPLFHQNGGGPGRGQSVLPATRVVRPDSPDGGSGVRWSSALDPRSQTPRRQHGQGGGRTARRERSSQGLARCRPPGWAGSSARHPVPAAGVSPGQAPPLAAIARSVVWAFAVAPATGSVAAVPGARRAHGDRGTRLHFSLASDPAERGPGRRLPLPGDSVRGTCLSRPQPVASHSPAGKAALPPPAGFWWQLGADGGLSALRGCGTGPAGRREAGPRRPTHPPAGGETNASWAGSGRAAWAPPVPGSRAAFQAV